MTIRTAIHPLGGGAIPSFYEEGQVVFEKSTPGSYSLEILQKGVYKIWAIGAGGGGGGWLIASNGAVPGGGCSGAGFIGLIMIDKCILSLSVGTGGAGRIVNGSTWPFTDNIGYKGTNTSVVSSSKTYLIANGGYGCYSDNSANVPAEKKAAAIVYCPSYVGTPELKASGIWGPQTGSGSASGGASVWGGYGAGGGAVYLPPSASSGGNGYLKIQFME